MDCSELLIFVFFGFGLTFCSQAHFYEYHHVNRPMTWTEAQRYCREKHTDLVTIESAEDMSKLKRSNSHTGLSWIGLTDDPKSWKGVMGNDVNSWRWSATGETAKTDYQNWAPNEPNYGQVREPCGFIDDNGLWLDGNCSVKYHFFCFNGRWWIGLYRVPWRWSDNSNNSFKNWQSGQPDVYYKDEHCVAENSDHDWADVMCTDINFFWCYKDLRVKNTMVRMKIQTTADLSDPAIHAQILQQLGERFKTLRSDVKLRWVTEPEKQEEETDEG
ncbi:uncharacterized protein LOC130172750 [Seriola aureovittata]|uniref:uncharacterized protein LOC130172750 n=1 Tax=Seriola aureovittata TaxID=2871759 RepID=UPI0024BEB339|nr:uncharacterized protein LOC130172750 [Seriola aureovittata]